MNELTTKEKIYNYGVAILFVVALSLMFSCEASKEVVYIKKTETRIAVVYDFTPGQFIWYVDSHNEKYKCMLPVDIKIDTLIFDSADLNYACWKNGRAMAFICSNDFQRTF